MIPRHRKLACAIFAGLLVSWLIAMLIIDARIQAADAHWSQSPITWAEVVREWRR